MFAAVQKAFIENNPWNKANQVLAIASISFANDNQSLKRKLEQAYYEEKQAHVCSDLPGIPERPLLADPKTMPKRKLGSKIGQQAMIHAIAHIEFSAINLALDAIQRFPEMPYEYHHNWLTVAQDESRHFLMLSARLEQLGTHYGAFEAHDGLWHMADQTQHAVIDRMAIVPRMMEARGLDVNPQIMQRLSAVGDHESVKLLETILADEINHVSIGNKWFHYACGVAGQSPNEVFDEKFRFYFQQTPKGALNVEARIAAGFTFDEIDYLEWLAAQDTI